MSKRKIKNNASLYINKKHEDYYQSQANNESFVFNCPSYDLHGMFVAEMLSFVATKIIALQMNEVNKMIFTTGKGTGALQLEIEQLFNENHLKYSKINDGEYLVWNEREPWN